MEYSNQNQIYQPHFFTDWLILQAVLMQHERIK